MEAFSYQKPTSQDNRKLILMLLAGASFGIWYFDLVPQLAPVSTGTLDADLTDPSLQKDDFLAMLGEGSSQLPGPDASVEELLQAYGDGADADPLLSKLTSKSDDLSDAFPEFGSLSEPEAHGSGGADPIQQVAFENSTPAGIDFGQKPQVLPSDLAEQLRFVDEWMTSQETLEAHAALSRIYWKQPEHRSFIYDRLQKTASEIYANPTAHFAEPRMVEFGETLEGIAKEYEVPWTYLAQLNSVTPQTLLAGQKLKVLKGPFSAVVDLKRMELTVHAHGWYVHHYSIGIGNDGGTPVGNFSVQAKQQNPEWNGPSGQSVGSDDPTNPLGEYWIGLGNNIGIHGTCDPATIGRTNQRGCIHLDNSDVAEVFNLLGTGASVVIRDR